MEATEVRPRQTASPNGSGAQSLEQRRLALFAEGSSFAAATRAEIVGIDQVLERIDEVLHWLRHWEHYTQHGSRLEPGIIFAGPPGTGKTLVARYMATESGALFVNAREFPLEGEWLAQTDVSALFRLARAARLDQRRPVLLFWDELDTAVSVGTPWGKHPNDVAAQLVAELDGVHGKNEGVLLIACTNTPGSLPPALLRRGRLGVTIPFQAPDLAGKTLLLEHYATRFSTAGPIDYGRVAGLFDEAAPASAIEEVVVEAWRSAVRRSIADDSRPALGHDDLRVAALDHTLGACLYRQGSPASLLRTAVHEVGHALTALAYGIPVRLLSTRPNATRLGLTSTGGPAGDPGTIEQGFARLRICLGGMLAEIEAGLGQGGGSGGDIASATQLASQLIAGHGLGRRAGFFDPSALGGPTGARSHPAVSEWLLSRVDQDAADLLQVAVGDVQALLGDIGGEALLALGERLAERETFDGREFEAAVCDVLGVIPTFPVA